MEELRKFIKTPQSETPTDSTPPSEPLQKWSENLSLKFNAYKIAMAQVIHRCLVLANRPTLESAELRRQAEIWADTLFNEIPSEHLARAVDRAVKDATNDFPLNAMSLLNAHKENVTDAAEAQETVRRLRYDEVLAESQSPEGFKCRACSNTGLRPMGRDIHNGLIFHYADNLTSTEIRNLEGYTGFGKCFERSCRYWEFRRQDAQNAKGKR